LASASSIIVSAGCWFRSRATSATVRWGPVTVSNTWSTSYSAGRASVPRVRLSSRAPEASTSFFRNAGSLIIRRCSGRGSARISFHTGNRSNGIWVLNESSAESERLWTWANIRPPAAAVSSRSARYFRQTSGTLRRLNTPKVMGRPVSTARSRSRT
jgi:hypothetical protein